MTVFKCTHGIKATSENARSYMTAS